MATSSQENVDHASLFSDGTVQDSEVRLKIQIPHGEHPKIIGQRGFKLQGICADTHGRIHFPDKNKIPRQEKSNDVSLIGLEPCVESARRTLRKNQPFVFTLEIETAYTVQGNLNEDLYLRNFHSEHSFITKVQIVNAHRMNVTFCAQQKYFNSLREDIRRFMNYVIRMKWTPLGGFSVYDISREYHAFVMGYNDFKIKGIMYNTGASISYGHILTDPRSTHRDPEWMKRWVRPKPSTIFIDGSFENVCRAFKDLLKSLPVTLKFSLSLEETQHVDESFIGELQRYHMIKIVVKKHNDCTHIYMHTTEKKVQKAYFARRQILTFVADQVRRERTVTTPFGIPSLFWAQGDLSASSPRQESSCFTPERDMDLARKKHNGATNTAITFKSKRRPAPLCLNQNTFTLKENCSTDSATNNLQQSVPLDGLCMYKGQAVAEQMSTNPFLIRKGYEKQKNSVVKKMEDDISGNVRSPTQQWSGYLYSKSLPNLFSLNLENKENDLPYQDEYKSKDDSYHEGIPEEPDSPLEKSFQRTYSSFFDSLTEIQRNSCNLHSPRFKNLKELLEKLELTQYHDLFLYFEIDLMTFLTLNETKLKTYGVRQDDCIEMLRAIEMMKHPALHEFTPKKTFNRAPGYERTFFTKNQVN